MQKLHKSRDRRRTSRATMKRVDAEATHIKGPQRDEKGDNKEGGC